MRLPNPLPPDRMSPRERREAVCALLARGLVRLHRRENPQHTAETGEIRLHFPPDRSRHANPDERETA